MVHVNGNDEGKFLKGAMWNFDDSKSVKAQIAKSGEKAPNCIWSVEENVHNGTVFKYYTERDSEGKVIRKFTDKGDDGVIDYVKYYEYDENGRLSKEKEDFSADGKIDEIKTYEYDADGNIRKVSFDYDADGNPNSIYEYNTSGEHVKSTNVYPNGDKSHSIYNNGRRIEEVAEYFENGELVKTVKEIMDNGYGVKSLLVDENADGVNDIVLTAQPEDEMRMISNKYKLNYDEFKYAGISSVKVKTNAETGKEVLVIESAECHYRLELPIDDNFDPKNISFAAGEGGVYIGGVKGKLWLFDQDYGFEFKNSELDVFCKNADKNGIVGLENTKLNIHNE